MFELNIALKTPEVRSRRCSPVVAVLKPMCCRTECHAADTGHDTQPGHSTHTQG